MYVVGILNSHTRSKIVSHDQAGMYTARAQYRGRTADSQLSDSDVFGSRTPTPPSFFPLFRLASLASTRRNIHPRALEFCRWIGVGRKH